MATQEVFFKDADGAVYQVRLPAIDARSAVSRFPSQWSEKPDKFAPATAHAKGSKPVGPNGIVGMTGGDPIRLDRLGVLGEPVHAAHA